MVVSFMSTFLRVLYLLRIFFFLQPEDRPASETFVMQNRILFLGENITHRVEASGDQIPFPIGHPGIFARRADVVQVSCSQPSQVLRFSEGRIFEHASEQFVGKGEWFLGLGAVERVSQTLLQNL